MNSRERLNTALDHIEPDRVPYDIAGTTVTGITRKAFVNAMTYRGIEPEYENEPVDPIQQIVTPSETILRQLNCDIRRAGARRIPHFENIVKRDGCILEVTDVWGCLWKMDESRDFYYNQSTWPLRGYSTIDEGLREYKAPDMIAHREVILQDLAGQLNNKDEYGIIIDRNCAGLTETSMRLRGYENWFLDTAIDQAGIEKLLDVVLSYKYQYWEMIADWLTENNLQGSVAVAAECDDLGTQDSTLLEPDFLRHAVIKRFAGLWSYIKKRLPGIKIFMHTCGAVRPLIPDLIEAGMDIYNPVQFTAAGMDLTALKKDFGKDVTFWGGGVNTQSTLRSGTPRQVSDEVKRIIDILAPGGGFVFNTVHNIQEDVPPENFWAMWETLMDRSVY